ncbi:MAG: hypothetical protein ACFNVN_08885, partial [Capnocytophaga ochracea]
SAPDFLKASKPSLQFLIVGFCLIQFFQAIFSVIIYYDLNALASFTNIPSAKLTLSILKIACQK